MSLDTDSGVRVGDRPRAGGRRRRALVVVVSVLAVVSLIGLYLYVNRSPGAGAGRPAALTGRLAADLAAQLERSSPTEHLSHGHALGTEPGRLLCTVELYGVDPALAATPEQVTRAYGYHLCALGSSAFVWDLAPKLVGPIIVDYTVRPPSVRVIESGEGYPERISQLMPERFQQQATKGFTDGQTVADLRARYRTVIPKP